MLAVYNDLASSEYRKPRSLSNECDPNALKRAINVLRHNIEMHVIPIRDQLERGELADIDRRLVNLLNSILPHFQIVIT
jgi:hypothetical protein